MSEKISIKVFTMIEINFNIIRKISKSEKLFAPKQQTSGGNTGVIFLFFIFKKR